MSALGKLRHEEACALGATPDRSGGQAETRTHKAACLGWGEQGGAGRSRAGDTCSFNKSMPDPAGPTTSRLGVRGRKRGNLFIRFSQNRFLRVFCVSGVGLALEA